MKIALIGSAPSSVNLAPFKDKRFDNYLGGTPPPQYPPSPYIGEDWIIHGCSPGAWATIPRADVWYEVHRWEPGQTWFSPQYTEFLRTFRGPVYVGGEIPEIQNAVRYPIEQVEEAFSAYFLHSSLSLMMAIAILDIEKARANRRTEGLGDGQTDADDVIGMWGVDMAAGEEYGDQRSGCQFFILEALRRGIGILLPPESCLLRPKPIYGLSEWNHDYIKGTARMRELSQRKSIADQQMAEQARQSQFLQGAMDDMNYWINTWTNPYGIPPGTVVRHTPGTGLGGGVTFPRPANPPQDLPDPAQFWTPPPTMVPAEPAKQTKKPRRRK